VDPKLFFLEPDYHPVLAFIWDMDPGQVHNEEDI
jgi:hypothetical protein